MAALPQLTVLAGGHRYRIHLVLLREEIQRRHAAGSSESSYVSIAEHCGVDRITLYRLLRGPVSLTTAHKICLGLGIEPSRVIVEVPEDYSAGDQLLASEDVLEQVERSDAPRTGLWMAGELTPFNRKLAPLLLCLALVCIAATTTVTWLVQHPYAGTFWYAAMAIILVAFFSIRIRWLLWTLTAVVATRLLLLWGGRLDVSQLLIEVGAVALYCAAIRAIGMYSRHQITQEAQVAVWADRKSIGELKEEARGQEWLSSPPGLS